MDTSQVNDLVGAFEKLRVERLPVAQQMIKDAGSIDAILADMANVLMFLYISRNIPNQDGKFRSTMESPYG